MRNVYINLLKISQSTCCCKCWLCFFNLFCTEFFKSLSATVLSACASCEHMFGAKWPFCCFAWLIIVLLPSPSCPLLVWQSIGGLAFWIQGWQGSLDLQGRLVPLRFRRLHLNAQTVASVKSNKIHLNPSTEHQNDSPTKPVFNCLPFS